MMDWAGGAAKLFDRSAFAATFPVTQRKFFSKGHRVEIPRVGGGYCPPDH
jgi:hypothetical protein